MYDFHESQSSHVCAFPQPRDAARISLRTSSVGQKPRRYNLTLTQPLLSIFVRLPMLYVAAHRRWLSDVL